MRSKRYRPYIRRPNGREKCDSYRMAIRLAFYRLSKKPFYVMVQHGFPNSVVDVASTRRELEQTPLLVVAGKCSFRQWARSVQIKANGIRRKTAR